MYIQKTVAKLISDIHCYRLLRHYLFRLIYTFQVKVDDEPKSYLGRNSSVLGSF